jgi:anti-anti-sigma factor
VRSPHLPETPKTKQIDSQVQVEQRGQISLVRLVGEHDLSTQDQIGAAIETAIQDDHDVVADLRSASFIDSSTLQALVAGSRKATDAGKRLTLVIGEERAVVQVFELTGLLDSFDCADSPESAITRLSG